MASAAIARSYQRISGSRPFCRQTAFNFIKYGTGSTRKFQYSLRRQTVHQAAEGDAVVHGQDIASSPNIVDFSCTGDC
jgi:hypothetical protein